MAAAIDPAAANTPGRACRRGSNWRKKCCFAAAVLYCFGQGQAREENVPRFEPEVDLLQPDEAAHQQSGARQQHERQRHFDHHQRAAQFAVPESAADAFARILERLHDIAPCQSAAPARARTAARSQRPSPG